MSILFAILILLLVVPLVLMAIIMVWILFIGMIDEIFDTNIEGWIKEKLGWFK